MKFIELSKESRAIKLERLMGEDLNEILSDAQAFVCGGAIRAIFANEKISDFDIYFSLAR